MRTATPTEYLLNIAKGNIKGHTTVHKFGTNEDVDIGTEGVWEHGGSINFPASALTMNIASTSANDTSAGTGARTIVIEGLDANWEIQSETITMNGQTIVTSANTYIRVDRAYIVTTGSGETNAGEVHVFTGTATGGEPDTATLVYSTISVDHGQTLQAFYTIPAGKTAYLLDMYASTDATTKEIQVKMFIRRGADVSTASWRINIDFKTGDSYIKEYRLPVQIPEKTDIKIEVTADANNTYVAGGFDLILVDN